MNVQPLNLSPSCPVLIGRTSQRATLQAMIERASNGQGQCALIHGEAGIGKSRLVAEVRQAAHGRGCRLLQGYCFPADSAHPYAPLFDLLRAFLIAPPLNSSATDDVSVLRELAHFLPDLAILLPDLAPSSLQQRSTPEQRKRRLFALMTHFLIEQSSGQPLVMIVEDLHWCDENTLELLLDCVRTCQQQPILFLFTYRNEEILPPLRHWLAQLDRTRLAVDLALFPLAQSEVAAMVQAICAAPQPPDPDLLAAVDRLAEGNPFFVEEVLTALLANGGLLDQDGNWQRQSESSALSSLALVPRTVQDRVQQRVERLSAVARRLLTIAACAGRGFDVPLLLQVLHANEEELLPLLKELLTAHLILEESADHFAFRHALVQQAIYNGLLLRERRALHLLIAQAIESRQAVLALPDSYMEALSHHFSLAGDWAKTVAYALRAGERSVTLYAPSAAIEQFTRALAAANALPTTPPSKAYLARGQAYQTRGDFARAKIDYEHALASAQQTSDGVLEWQSVMALGALWAGRDYSQAGEWFQRALDQAAQLNDPALRARSLNRMGNWLSNTGRSDEGLLAHQQAIALFAQANDQRGMAETFDLLGTTYGMRGDRVKAVEHFDQAISLLRLLDDRQSLLSSLAMRALQSQPGANETTICPARTPQSLITDATEALTLARQTESLPAQVFTQNALAFTQLAFGDLGVAMTNMQAARRVANDIQHQQWIIANCYGVGSIYLALLAPAPAVTVLREGLTLAHQLGSAFWIATLTAAVVRAQILQGDLVAAQAALQAVMPHPQQSSTIGERMLALVWGELYLAQGKSSLALHIADQLLATPPGLSPDQPLPSIPHLLKLRGDALMVQGELDPAIAALTAAQQGALDRNFRPFLWTIQRSLGQAYLRRRREDDARQVITAARQLVEEMAATLADAPTREQFLQTALATLPTIKALRPTEVAKRAFGGLTGRERQVAMLVAQGKTSREIANQLVISERTAEVHVSNILGKLGFGTRAQIAAWAVEVGLV